MSAKKVKKGNSNLRPAVCEGFYFVQKERKRKSNSFFYVRLPPSVFSQSKEKRGCVGMRSEPVRLSLSPLLTEALSLSLSHGRLFGSVIASFFSLLG